MKEMKTASIVSVALHAAVLLWALISFSGKALDAPSMESLPVDLVTTDQFSKMMKGVKDAPKKDEPAPLVEKQAEEKAPDQPTPKVVEKKQEIAPQPAAPPPEASQPPPDAIAEKLKQEKPKEQAKAETKPVPPKKPDKPQPKFDAEKIAALLDKRDAQRTAATGDVPNTAPSLGTSQGNGKVLSQSELDALRSRLMSLWSPPVGIQNPEQYIIRVRIQLKSDGRLAAPPMVLNSGNGPIFASARDSAMRAVFRAQPFDMLKRETYDTWKDIEVTFDPRDMFRG
ncbi:MAG: cell envelope integrity protein TolA [Pseudolabrys sp.]|nr:cell envelope integrity protein TolA [Pseudolabrys sp.]